MLPRSSQSWNTREKACAAHCGQDWKNPPAAWRSLPCGSVCSIELPDKQGATPGTLHEPRLFGGGTGANTAAVLGRLGVPVYLAAMVGDDGYGRFVVRDLAANGVDVAGVLTHPDACTPTVIALIQPDGERWLVVWPTSGGAPGCFQPSDLDGERIRAAAWLHTTGMCLRAAPVRDAVLYAMAQARAAGVPVSVDLNLRLELWGWADNMRAVVAQAIELADVVFGAGVDEIMPTAGADSVEQAARDLSGGTRTIVARLGAQGVLAVTPQGDIVRAPAYPVPVVSTLGAGDAFDAGFIAARVAGLALDDALRWANAAAALTIMHPSARGDLSRAAIERLVAGSHHAG